MREYFTEAIVLERKVSGETDGRIFLYTKTLGKINARARSIYKITSRLSGILQPMRRVKVRLVEKISMQIVDALTYDEMGAPREELVSIYHIVQSLTPENHADERLWKELNCQKPSALRVLAALGFDPRHAQCGLCEIKTPEYFLTNDTRYYCSGCVRRLNNADRLALYHLKRNSVSSVLS